VTGESELSLQVFRDVELRTTEIFA